VARKLKNTFDLVSGLSITNQLFFSHKVDFDGVAFALFGKKIPALKSRDLLFSFRTVY